jgi:putative Mg2+ transporter-C (MgtC) family protein
VAVAAALGGAVGLERELREREAGFRTHMLVAVGSALFTLVSAYGFEEFLMSGDAVIRADPTRIAAQIVTGIGFLGAATLWVVAAIGLASGAGYYSAAVITTLVALFSLWPLRILAHTVTSRVRPETGRLVVQLPAGTSPGDLISELERLGGRVHAVEVSHEADRRTVLLDVALPARAESAVVVARLADLEDVLEVRWSD